MAPTIPAIEAAASDSGLTKNAPGEGSDANRGVRPAWAPWVRVEVVDAEGVYVLTERSNRRFRGEVYRRLAPLLVGQSTADELVDRLPECNPPEVYFALRRLSAEGFLLEAPGVRPDRAVLLHTLGLVPGPAEARLATAQVGLHSLGGVPQEPLRDALSELEIAVGEPGTLTVVVTDDYLQPALAEFNAQARAASRQWLLVKPLGNQVWLGPLFRPGTACWECLAHRLRGQRELELYLQRRLGGSRRQPDPAQIDPLGLGWRLTALEITRVLGGAPDPPTLGAVVSLDLTNLQSRRHVLVRRPQCPACGERSRRHAHPIRLESVPKTFRGDGGHRSVSPDHTLERLAHHVSPITGAVSTLDPLPPPAGADLMSVYVGRHLRGLLGDSAEELRFDMLGSSWGKGTTATQARTSALSEALERYSGQLEPGDVRLRASYRELGEAAVHPNSCMLFSRHQYGLSEDARGAGARPNRIPQAFDEGAVVAWSGAWSLTRQQARYLPTGYCFYGFPDQPGPIYYFADSNGCAAGNTYEEAILQGLCELVERDNVALWWYNRARVPAVDLKSFDEPYVERLIQEYRRLDRELWVLDVTADLGVYAFVAVSRCLRGEEDIQVGYGAHLDPRIALLRALTELNQMLVPSQQPQRRAQSDLPSGAEKMGWRRGASLSDHVYLAPAESRRRTRGDYPDLSSDDLAEDVRRCQATLEARGLELLVVDQTRPDIGLPVVRVVVPGLRHFWPRFAPGRLYDVPLLLGWRRVRLTEAELNPVGIYG